MDSRAVDRMVAPVPSVAAAARVGAGGAALGQAPLAELAVLDGNRFVGLVRLERLLAAAFLAFALGVWGAGVAGASAAALFVSASLATVIVMLVPYALARLGRDPAFGSGPLATVIQDLLSILVYFAIASALV